MKIELTAVFKTYDVKSGRRDVDPRGRFRGEWVKLCPQINSTANQKNAGIISNKYK